MLNLRRLVLNVQQSIKSAESLSVDLAESKGTLTDFKQRQKFAAKQDLLHAVKQLKESIPKLPEDSELLANELNAIDGDATLWALKMRLERIAGLVAELPEDAEQITIKVPNDIMHEINADIEEINKCFNASCFRSAVILCGRIMETALHRKYFDATGIDLLEKAPGTGLGNLIAKLAEKGISTDPGLNNQIHLINQVRISNVHHKKDVFLPSKDQTKAIMLYTIDAVNTLFK